MSKKDTVVVNFIYFYLQQPRATLKPLKQSPYSRIDDGVSSVNKPKVYFDVLVLNGIFDIRVTLNILMETKTIIPVVLISIMVWNSISGFGF